MENIKKFNEYFSLGRVDKKQIADKVRNDKKEVFKKTDDNWHGNYGDNHDEVKLIYHSIINYYEQESKWVWRTSVWGTDDSAMYKDFNDEQGAIELFNTLNSMDKINYSDCENLGMEMF